MTLLTAKEERTPSAAAADSLKSNSSSAVSFHLILFSVFPLFLPSPGEKQPPLAKEGEKEKVAGEKKVFFAPKKWVGGIFLGGWWW